MPDIILATLNARHIHSSLALRYLLANMGDLRDRTELREYTLESRPNDIAEHLLLGRPRIIGLGIYLWNCEQSTRLAALIKTVSPETVLVLGGPEVSHEWEAQPIVRLADYLITGPADLTFAELCRSILLGDQPQQRVIHAQPPPLHTLASPYPFYSDQDIAHRLLYVEASRGCPFRCEFCLSALDRSARPFDLEPFFKDMELLLQRGASHFKFVDRTFNLKLGQSLAILDFFLARMQPGLFLHFEVIPDRLPAALKSRLRQFPEGALQLEVGVQTFNPEVAERISRKQDTSLTRQNLHWLRSETRAHIHADLIIGLPGEGVESFAAGFDQLVALRPQEIQVGVLKRLRGTPIARHSEAFGMRYNPNPPYDILSTDRIDFAQMQRLNRFARYWDLIGNSGRFPHTLPLLLGEQPFQRFMQLSDWLFASTGQVHRFALTRLFDLLCEGCVTQLGLDRERVVDCLSRDFQRCAVKGLPASLQGSIAAGKPGSAARDSRSARQQRYTV
ncbi:MAG: DUF4080 domain-containing protein [Gammaproteobacteria bacterium]|nr:DUF4080 domain-containing protein [Gammaproteobacteria bacterium]